MTPKQFFDVLFEPGDGICFGKTKYETSVSHNADDKVDATHQFFSINALVDRRLDVNVTSFRNVLLEFDHGTREEQLALVESIPYSTLVHSGSKSFHAVISLETPLETREQYDDLVDALYEKVPQADKTARNPSRFSRAPSALRENRIEQKLIAVRSRISLEDLCRWAGVDPKTLGTREREPAYRATHKLLPVRALAFIKYGATEGSWNIKLFQAACDMFSVGYNKDEVVEMCSMASGSLDKNDKRTIDSARKNVNRES